MLMRHIIVSLLVAFSLLSASCASKLPSFRPYKMDIQQGNVVTSKMMLQLRPGMTKSQVRFIMGTPLIQDSFHSNRWDYFYQMRKEGKIVEQRRVILDFDKEALVRVRGDVIPAGTGDPAAEPTTGTEPISQPEDKRSLIDKLKFWKKDEKAQNPEPQAAPTDLVSPAAKPAAVKPDDAKPADIKPESAEQAPTGQQAAPEPAAPESAPAPESKPEPAPVPPPAPALPPEPVTDPAEPAPASRTPEPVAEPEPAKVEEPAVEPAQRPAPAEQSKPVVAPEPEAKPAEEPAVPSTPEPAAEAPAKPQAKPAGRQVPEKAPEPKATEAAPPQEGEPGYFEYMLEKIGF
jgi:outer membrane protein assembly factor BamE